MTTGEKSDKILERILVGGILTAGAVIFGYIGYDAFNSTKQIERGAKQRGVSFSEVCREKGRNDILEMMMIKDAVKNWFGCYNSSAYDSLTYNSSAQPAQK